MKKLKYLGIVFIICCTAIIVNASVGEGTSEVGTLSSLTTSVEVSNEPPKDFQLMQNHPNPFNPTTTIQYSIPVESSVKISIYDIMGVQVETLLNKKQAAGYYNITFDARSLPSGIYFYTIRANYFLDTKKMILLK